MRFLSLLCLLFVSPLTHAQSLDEHVSALFTPLANALSGFIFFALPVNGTQFPLIVGWLILAGLVCTLYFRLPQVSGFKHAIDLVRGKHAIHGHDTDGVTTHFQALSMALSGTVGLGNIAGVAVAISIGGAGATFWMILAGFFGMAAKFTECTLAVKYRNRLPDGTVSGGPMYYLSQGFAEKGMPTLGRAMALVFAFCCIGGSIGAGNMFQANQAYEQVLLVTGGDSSWLAGRGWVFGLVTATLLGAVIIGGVQSIATVTSRLVPLMVFIYVGAALFILGVQAEHLPVALTRIWDGAFTADGVTGGVVGAIIQGFKRAAFSNEAGLGSAAIAHSTVRTPEPASEGHVALLEPFIDTIIICTMTALVLNVTDRVGVDGLTGVQLTSDAFGSVVSWFPYVLAVSVLLFAFSTMVSWFYYGLKAVTYLMGHRPVVELGYKLFFCACTVIGASVSLGPVIDFSDAMVFLMAIPNVIGIYVLMPVVRQEVASYRARVINRRTPS